MKRFQIITILFLIGMVIAACGKEEEKKTVQDTPPIPISVDLTVPETADMGQEVVLTAKVTQGEEVVKDAKEVEFEVLEEATGEKQMYPAHLVDDTYTVKVTFEQPGSYSITSHVTARDMHTMPTKTVEVQGEATATPQENAEGHSHHHGTVIKFEDGKAKAGKSVTLSPTISLENAPLTEAAVRFEIWKDGSDQHDWVDAKESEGGKYSADYTFKETGKYSIQVHVEKHPDLHDHVIKTYVVE